MKTDELRLAAERELVRANRQLAEYEAEDHDDPELLQMLEGLKGIFEAYLSEHPPDDGEPLTTESIEAHLKRPIAVRQSKRLSYFVQQIATDLNLVFYPALGDRESLICINNITIHWSPTNGYFRNLIAALKGK